MNMQSLNLPKDVTPIVTCTIQGILEPEDLLRLQDIKQVGGEPGLPTAPLEDSPHDIKVVRERHHSVARLVASGMTQRLVSTITRYTENYISVLLDNPAMIELVTFYRMQYGAGAEVIAEKVRTLGTQAVEKLQDKLDNGENISTQDLIAMSKLGLDRSGHGPTHKHEVRSEQHVIDHAQLAEINRQAREGSRTYIQAPPRALPAPSPSEDDEHENS